MNHEQYIETLFSNAGVIPSGIDTSRCWKDRVITGHAVENNTLVFYVLGELNPHAVLTFVNNLWGRVLPYDIYESQLGTSAFTGQPETIIRVHGLPTILTGAAGKA